MLKFVPVTFALLAIAAATNFEYYNNGIEYDVSPNIIAPMPYPYRDEFIGHRVNLERRPSYVSLVEAEEEPHTDVVVSSQSGLVATVVSHAIGYASSVVSFVVKNFSALVVGSTVALGICRLTSLCSQDTLHELQNCITPQRIRRATEFLESAIRKYRAMQ